MHYDTCRPSRLRSTIDRHGRQISRYAALVLLAGCANPEATAAQREGGSPGHLKVATAYYQGKLSQCGDSYVTTWTFSDKSGSRLVELKGVRYATSPIPLSQADRLNGLEDSFESWIEPTAVRQTSSARGDWQPWRDLKSAFRFRFVKASGKSWNATIVSAEISGFMAKCPCDEVPGHPARLAREQAAQALESQARQVGEVTFKCGPVRNFSGYGTEMISVTDASVIGVSGVNDSSVAFIDAQFFSKIDADRLDGPGLWFRERPYNPGGSWGFRFRGPSAIANRDACYDAIAASYEGWRSRFPTLAKLPPESTAPASPSTAQAIVAPPGTELASPQETAAEAASGTYSARTGTDYVELRGDGTFVLRSRGQTMRGTFTIQGDDVMLVIPTDPRPARARLSGNGLTFPSGDIYTKR